jgi:hypothetical protein
MLASMRLFGDGKPGPASQIGDLSRSCLPHHVECSTRDSLLPVETPLAADRRGADHALAEGLDPSEAERVFGFRQATSTSLSHSRWETGTDLARAVLLPSLAPSPPLGGTANQTALRSTRASFSGWSSTPARALRARPPDGSSHAAHRVIHSRRPLLAAFLPPSFQQ